MPARTPLLAFLFLLVSGSATAGEVYEGPHYDKRAITNASSAFRAVGTSLQESYVPLEQEVSRTDSLLAELDLTLALTEGAADAAHHKLWTARLNERSGVFGPEFQAIQNHIREMEEVFMGAFEGALKQALATLAAEGVEARPCEASGGSLGAIQPGFSQGSAGCPGEDVSVRIAAMWDKDKELKAKLDAALAGLFPAVTTYREASDSVSLGKHPAGDNWLSPANLAAAIPEAVELFDTVDRMADAARKDLRAAYQGLDPEAKNYKEQADTVVAKARGIRAFAKAAKASAGKELWSALERARRKGKKAGWQDVVVCLNPGGWGGCRGTDRSDEVAAAVTGDKRLQKALAKLLASLEPPDVRVP